MLLYQQFAKKNPLLYIDFTSSSFLQYSHMHTYCTRNYPRWSDDGVWCTLYFKWLLYTCTCVRC